MSQFPKPKIAAHRGLAWDYPENTMASFEAAARCNPDFIELDFHSASDGTLMCVHDFKLDRYVKDCQPQHVGRSVSELTVAQLQAIDMGSWKNADFKGTSMPTLQAVLERFTLSDSANSSGSVASPKLLLEHKTGRALQLFDLLQHVKPQPDSLAVMSFHWDFLKDLRKLDATLPLTLLGKGQLLDEQIATANALNAVAMCWNHELTRSDIGRLHAADLQAWVYTLNTSEQWLRAREIGVDVIATDRCDQLGKFDWS